MIDVLRVLDDLGIEYRVSGDEATALCPSPDHHDRHPSWSVNIETGAHHCFACSFGGSLSWLVRTLRKAGKDEADLWLRTRSTGLLEAAPARDEAPEEDEPQPVTEAALALFTPPPERQLRKRNISAASCAALGILWDEQEREWILPFRDADGRLHGWQSKRVRKGGRVRNNPDGIKKARFLFGLHAARGRTAVLVESPLDVARLRDAGIRGGISSYGVRVSKTQLALIADHFDNLVLALDNDDAGREQTERLSAMTFATRFNYGSSRAKDPGEMTDEEIRWGIENPVPELTFTEGM